VTLALQRVPKSFLRFRGILFCYKVKSLCLTEYFILNLDLAGRDCDRYPQERSTHVVRRLKEE